MFTIEALVRYTGAFMQIISGVTSIAVTLGKSAEILPNLEYFFRIAETESKMEYGTKEIDLEKVEIEFRHVLVPLPRRRKLHA